MKHDCQGKFRQYEHLPSCHVKSLGRLGVRDCVRITSTIMPNFALSRTTSGSVALRKSIGITCNLNTQPPLVPGTIPSTSEFRGFIKKIQKEAKVSESPTRLLKTKTSLSRLQAAFFADSPSQRFESFEYIQSSELCSDAASSIF